MLLGDVGKAAPEGRKPQLGLLALELVSGGGRVAHATDQLVGQAIRRDETGAVHRDVERDHANAIAGAVVMKRHVGRPHRRGVVHPHGEHVDLAGPQRPLKALRVDDHRCLQAQVPQGPGVLLGEPGHLPARRAGSGQVAGRAQTTAPHAARRTPDRRSRTRTGARDRPHAELVRRDELYAGLAATQFSQS
jgi:hypothetical protein